MKGLSKSELQIQLQLVQEKIIYEFCMNIGTRDSKVSYTTLSLYNELTGGCQSL